MAKQSTLLIDKEAVQSGYSTPIVLNTHGKINTLYNGDVEKLESSYARVSLETNEGMCVDDAGLVHGGFIFSAADFAAMAAVNEPNVVLTSCNCFFTAQVRLGDVVIFEATEYLNGGRIRNISVRGFVHDVQVFEGKFKAVVTERHLLRLDLMKNIDK